MLSKIRLGESAQLAENFRPMDFMDMSCPMCFEKPGPSRRAFVTHVGEHMEQLALVTLIKGASDESGYGGLSIPTGSFGIKQMSDGLSSNSQKKSVFRLPSDHQYPSPDEFESLYTEYSSAGGPCSQQEYIAKLMALEQQNQVRHFGFVPCSEFHCAFCDTQHKGKHELRMHLAKIHLLEPPLHHQKTEKVSKQKAPGADAIIKCICGFQEDDGSMVICTRCKTWQHNICYYYLVEGLNFFSPTTHHMCADCEPRELDAKGAAKRMDNFRRQGFGVEYVTLGSIGQRFSSPPDPDFDEAQVIDSFDQKKNPDAFKWMYGPLGPALKQVDLAFPRRAEPGHMEKKCKKIPEYSDNQQDSPPPYSSTWPDESDGSQLTDANEEAYDSALKKVEVPHSGLSVGFDYEDTRVQQNKKRVPDVYALLSHVNGEQI